LWDNFLLCFNELAELLGRYALNRRPSMPRTPKPKSGRKRGAQPAERKLAKPLILRLVELAELLMVDQSRITQLTQEGLMKRVAKGEYDLRQAVQDYIRYLRDQQKRQTLVAADSRVRDARAKDIEARTAQRLGQLVSLSVYDEMIDGFAGVVRSELAGIPARCTRDLVMRRIIERELNAGLRRMAEYAMAQSIRVEAMGGPNASERTNGAGPVGGGKSDVPADGSGSGAS
jgi:phage terminase Nu1 subunit (DNA packaging protein)